jgi:hypothetical protein
MTEEHERQAEAVERELEDMEERSERVGEHIDETRKDWEAKIADPAVPGAGGDPDRAEEGGRHPETNYPAKGSSEEAAQEDPMAGHGRSGDSSDDDAAAERAPGEELPPPDPTETD